MSIDRLLDPVPVVSRLKKTTARKTAKAKGTRKNKTCRVSPVERPGLYDVVSALTNAQSGITFGQRWHGGATSAKKELGCIFGKGKMKLGVFELSSIGDDDEIEERCLAISLVQVHGTEVYALMDSKATPNVISPKFARKLVLQPKETKSVVTVATSDKSLVQGKLDKVSVQLGDIEALIDFIDLPNVPFYIVIGRPTLKRLGAELDFKSEEVRLNYRNKTEALPMVPEYTWTRALSDNTDSEDFTSGSEDAESSCEDDGKDQEALVLVMRDDIIGQEEEISTESELRKKLSHLAIHEIDQIVDLHNSKDVVANTLYDLKPSHVPHRHSFELIDTHPSYHRARRVAPKQNDLVRMKLDLMLRAGIITPASSAWSFPVVIATKKEEGQDFV